MRIRKKQYRLSIYTVTMLVTVPVFVTVEVMVEEMVLVIVEMTAALPVLESSQKTDTNFERRMLSWTRS